MFDGEEIPHKKPDGEQSEEPTDKVDEDEHDFASTSQNDAQTDTIELQVMTTTTAADVATNSINENPDMKETSTESSESESTQV